MPFNVRPERVDDEKGFEEKLNPAAHRKPCQKTSTWGELNPAVASDQCDTRNDIIMMSMANLTVKDLPDAVYRELKVAATPQTSVE